MSLGEDRGGDDARCMRVALDVAREAARYGDVPVGAVLRLGDRVVARAGNRVQRDRDPTAHAEMLCLRELHRLERQDGDRATLYVTLEPCAMCAGALVLARVDRLVFGAWDDKAGMAGSVGDLVRHLRLNHRLEVAAGVLSAECGDLLQSFFREKRGRS